MVNTIRLGRWKIPVPFHVTAATGVAMGCALLVPLTLCSDIRGADLSGADSSEHFHLALPGYTYAFPRDHGSHDSFRTEWWYYTGHLVAENGRRFGYELTFFRRGVAPPVSDPNPSRWAMRHLYLAHFAVTDVTAGEFRYAEKLSRAALGKAGAETGRLHVWIDRWSTRMDPSREGMHHLQASTKTLGLDLSLTPTKRPIPHGRDGVSQKGAARSQASHYYSLTRLVTTGTLRVNDQVMTVHGQSWMDHEFSSTELGDGQVGWDWFSVQFDDQTELMFYLLRRKDGTPDPASSGTVVSAEGQAEHLTVHDVEIVVLDHWVSQTSGTRYPIRWRVTVPHLQLSLELTPLLLNQELITSKTTRVTYWEGAVAIHGTRSEEVVKGQGYVEMTGYAKPFDQRL